MAHASLTNPILDELVAEVSKLSPRRDAREFKKQRDIALRITKSNNYARVNQFEVENTLQGLVEKFQVLNRDDLSLALAEKLHSLKEHADKWTPDILFFLLQLSDQPVKKLPPYVAQSRSTSPGQPELTWDQLLKEDPYSDEELWKNVTYSPISSDSEDDSLPSLDHSSKPRSKSSEETARDKHMDNEPFELVDNDLLLSLSQIQTWGEHFSLANNRGRGNPNIPEIHAIREVLLALRGLPTALFRITEVGNVEFRGHFKIDQITNSVFSDLMSSFASIAERVLFVRIWASKIQKETLHQSFSASVQKQIQIFDNEIGQLESSLLITSGQVTVSLMHVLEDIRLKSKALVFLQSSMSRFLPFRGPFSHLESLYDLMCEQQASGDLTLFQFLGTIFFESLQSFLRPIQKWMAQGSIGSDVSSFFIVEMDGPLDNASIWNDQFHFRVAENQEMLAPKFIQTSSKRIMNTGKSITFLHKLGIDVEEAAPSMANLSFEDVCVLDGSIPLASFPVLFDHAFSSWIESMYGPAANILRDQLFTTYQLQQSLAALQDIYLSTDGTRLQALADPMFEAIDNRTSVWNDKYLLSERLKAVFAECPGVDTDLLTIRAAMSKTNARSIRVASNIAIEYHLSWPVMNVVRKQSLVLYQRTFRLLLQIYRAKYLLRNTIFFRERDTRNTLATALRQQLQWLVDTLLSHFLYSVIQPLSEQMRHAMPLARDLDEMIEVHDRFITSVQIQCLLSKNLAPIYQALVSILELAVQFSDCRRQQIGLRSRHIRHGAGPATVQFRRRSTARQRRRSGIVENSESSDESQIDNNTEDAYEADTETLTTTHGSHNEQMARIKDELDKLCSFIVTGLRGIGRAGGEDTWEMLADRLDWRCTSNKLSKSL